MSERDDGAEIVSLADRRAERTREVEAADREARRAEADSRARQQQSSRPEPYASYVLLGLNVAVWLLMVGMGVDAFEPSSEELVDWGANFGPKTASGQWWRLLTATFLHGGLIHLGFNIYFLWVIGRITEQIFRAPAYLVIYFGSGLCASAASLAWNPIAPSVGASGALLGVFGAFLGFTLRRREVLPPEFVQSVRRNAMVLIGLNVAVAFFMSNIDNAAHVGGLVAGLGIGYLITTLAERPVQSRQESLALQRRLSLMVGAGVAVLVAGACVLLRTDPEIMVVYDQVEVLNRTAFSAYNEAETDEDRAKAIEEVTLPAIVDLREALAEVEQAPRQHREDLDKFRVYAEKTEQALRTELEALRSGDPLKMLEAKRLYEEAESAL
ncbi:Rhomboid-like protein [Plesiocystis pacifica SIR-1]|uniref:Rhomboid-like protein n=1 Tax=Plesiocystis pacifica SIR-1 TaxID=391625 RepID=A6G432_9BACT|nr:rhomboid family intramembrane serine protease [Plesiocystis pacifica]EDM79355.1 Rhomboid-like protein [Plesiocystis pacifica SIR-1]